MGTSEGTMMMMSFETSTTIRMVTVLGSGVAAMG